MFELASRVIQTRLLYQTHFYVLNLDSQCDWQCDWSFVKGNTLRMIHSGLV